MNKLLSIIIPTYNMEKYLDKCLTSLVLKDDALMKMLEVIIVIDGSTDRSSEIAHTYQDKYPKTFIVIDKENGNYGSCINRGLKESKGKYVKILDADDSFNTIGFEKFLIKISSFTTEIDVLLSGYNVVDEEGRIRSKYTRDLSSNKVLKWDDVNRSFVNGRHVAMHEITYRTSMLKEMNYVQTEGISYTDQEWVFYPMAHAKTFYLINEDVYMYLVGRAGQTMDPIVLQKGVGANIVIAKKMISFYKKNYREDIISIEYLKNNLLWLLNHIYSICLLSNKEGIELDKLVELNAFLLNASFELYENVENFKTPMFRNISFRYAKKWQDAHNKEKIPFSIRCFLFFRNLVRND